MEKGFTPPDFCGFVLLMTIRGVLSLLVGIECVKSSTATAFQLGFMLFYPIFSSTLCISIATLDASCGVWGCEGSRRVDKREAPQRT